MSLLSQYAVFAASIVFLLFLVTRDLNRSFARLFMRLSIWDVLSPQFFPILSEPLDLFGSGKTSLLFRYYAWPVVIVTVLLGVSWSTLYVDSLDVVAGILPHAYFQFKQAVLSEYLLVDISVRAIALYLLFRIPGENDYGMPTRLQDFPSAIRSSLRVYSSIRNKYIDLIILRGRKDMAFTVVSRDFHTTVAAKAPAHFIDSLRDEILQPTGGSTHQVVIGYLHTHGARRLYERVGYVPLILDIDVGSAFPVEVAEFLTQLSRLYEANGGIGLTYLVEDPTPSGPGRGKRRDDLPEQGNGDRTVVDIDKNSKVA